MQLADRGLGELQLAVPLKQAGRFVVVVDAAKRPGAGDYFYIDYDPGSEGHVVGLAEANALCRSFGRNVRLNGNTYRTVTEEDVLQPCIADGDCPCQKECARDRRCVAWTLVPDVAAKHGDPRCSLMDSLHEEVVMPGLISGVKEPLMCSLNRAWLRLWTVEHTSGDLLIRVESNRDRTNAYFGDRADSRMMRLRHLEPPSGNFELRTDVDMVLLSANFTPANFTAQPACVDGGGATDGGTSGPDEAVAADAGGDGALAEAVAADADGGGGGGDGGTGGGGQTGPWRREDVTVSAGHDRRLNLTDSQRTQEVSMSFNLDELTGDVGVVVNWRNDRGMIFYMEGPPKQREDGLWLGIGAHRSKPGCQRFMPNWQMTGTEILSSSSPALLRPCPKSGHCPCQRACDLNSQCRAWTLVPEGTPHGPPRCILRGPEWNSVGREPLLTSGIKHWLTCDTYKTARLRLEPDEKVVHMRVLLGLKPEAQWQGGRAAVGWSSDNVGDIVLRADTDITYRDVVIGRDEVAVCGADPPQVPTHRLRRDEDRVLTLPAGEGVGEHTEVAAVFQRPCHASRFGVVLDRGGGVRTYFFVRYTEQTAAGEHVVQGGVATSGGDCRPVMRDVQLLGESYAMGSRYSTTCDETNCMCRSACRSDRRCRAWTLDGTGRCYRWDHVPKTSPGSGITSGIIDPFECAAKRAVSVALLPDETAVTIRVFVRAAAVEATFQQRVVITEPAAAPFEGTAALHADSDLLVRSAEVVQWRRQARHLPLAPAE